MQHYQRLLELLGETYDLGRAMAVLGWDQQTYMPEGGSEDRGYQLATLAGIEHLKSTSDEMGNTLAAAEAEVAGMPEDSDAVSLVRYTRHIFEKRTRVSTKFVSDFTRLTAVSQDAWVKARAENDFESFRPYLEQVIDMRREYATFFGPYEHVYDPQLDDFERGMKTAEVKAIFDELRPQQVALLKAISERPQVNDDFLHVAYSEQGQWDFGVDVITRFGYDWKRGRQDKTAHPFTTSFGLGDVRITTRFDPERSASALFSTTHEAGHAMYEQGFSPAYRRTPLADGASMAIHESQSRMWENLVSRSLPFWRFFYPKLQEHFSSQLSGVSLEAFYKGINKVEPSLIRVEADEATYNLHIMLRLELEIAMAEGQLAVKDLPEAWDARMQDYLGITPPNDTLGVLQDIHWAGGMFGYFPTYALGNLVSVQLWEKILQDIPDLEDQMERGEFGALLTWLRANVHQYGAKFAPQELVKRITGTGIDPKPYMRYLTRKYSEIYGL